MSEQTLAAPANLQPVDVATSSTSLQAPVVAQPRMSAEESAEEFLQWEHQGIAEWVNGEIITLSVKYEHQRIVDFLNALLRLFTQMLNLGVICTAPYPMRIRPGGNLREPDLVYVSSEHTHRITSQALEGPADLSFKQESAVQLTGHNMCCV